MRLLGPNCLGTYSPRGRITFTETDTMEIGTVGVVSQSGGLGTDTVRRGTTRGLKFSGLVTVGNCADLTPSGLESRINRSIASMMSDSVTVSTELVGSSRMRIGASLRNARASEIR